MSTPNKAEKSFDSKVLVKFNTKTIHMLSGKKKMRLFDKQRTIGYINKHLREILQFPEETPLIIVIGSFAPSPSSTLEQLQAFYTTPDSKEAQKGYFGVLNLDYYDNASFG